MKCHRYVFKKWNAFFSKSTFSIIKLQIPIIRPKIRTVRDLLLVSFCKEFNLVWARGLIIPNQQHSTFLYRRTHILALCQHLPKILIRRNNPLHETGLELLYPWLAPNNVLDKLNTTTIEQIYSWQCVMLAWKSKPQLHYHRNCSNMRNLMSVLFMWVV